jgi:hypothetical protein
MMNRNTQNVKVRYDLNAMLQGLDEQYPEIGHVPSESLTQEKIGEVFARRKNKKRQRIGDQSSKHGKT